MMITAMEEAFVLPQLETACLEVVLVMRDGANMMTAHIVSIMHLMLSIHIQRSEIISDAPKPTFWCAEPSFLTSKPSRAEL